MPAPGYRLANYDMSHAHGYWGPVTSNIDWCESNYEVTYYIAEFWNTLTTVAMILPPIIGALSSFTKMHVELRYLMPFFMLIVVGLGSGLFHMTLLYEMQLMDELPMIWGTATLLYAIHDIYKIDNSGFNKPLAGALLFACSLSTIVSFLYKKTMFDQ